jgi:hypothetical protein
MNEQEQPSDDLNVQITDLPGEPERTNAPRPGEWDRRRGSRRRLRLALIVGVMALALLIILGESLPLRSIAPLAFFRAKPTPTLAPGSNLYYIFGDQPWGKIYLDGRLISNTPLIDSDPPAQILARGTHHFVWDAAPFPPRRCTISVPASPGDTCQFVLFNLPGAPPGRMILFHDTLNDLPHMQAAALTRQIQAQLDALQSSTLVEPEELYASSLLPDTVSAADQPLRAVLRYQLDTSVPPSTLCIMQNVCQVSGEECATLCTLPGEQLFWDVGAVVKTVWDYTTLSGRPVAVNQPDTAGNATLFEHPVTLFITWDGSGWHVTVQTANPFESYVPNLTCASAEDDITGDSALAGTWRLVPAPNAADGCLAVATIDENDGGLSSPSHPIIAYCLHRFGVLLAANDAAHRLWPFLPVADPAEQSLALQLAKSPGWTFSIPPS